MNADSPNFSDAPALRGVYPAARASALSGVPISTVYEWARGDQPLLIPSISPTRVKLWSWADLVALRAIYWLRHPTQDARRATTMNRVRDMLREVENLIGRLGTALASSTLKLHVDGGGHLYLEHDTGSFKRMDVWPQTVSRELVVDLLSSFSVDGDLHGPDLRVPRPSIRIVPGKLAGEPHVESTRIETRVLAALSRRGMEDGIILELYPSVSSETLYESLDLERQLERNLHAAA